MTTWKAWISAARLRTLPLSLSGIIVGSGLAYKANSFNLLIAVLAMFTTIGFQVISNFANDYGDGVKGTDNKDRVGPERAIQSGAITPKKMKTGIIITAVITFFLAVFLIYTAFGSAYLAYTILFLVLGIGAIVAAIKYTVGKSAYGYKGLGDIFVFIFFGLVSVLGSYFLYTKSLNWELVLPSLTIGFLSVAVLNLNNMRDHKNDANSGKNTLVVKWGFNKARRYHFTIIILAMLATLIFTFVKSDKIAIKNFLYILAFVPLCIHLITVYKIENPAALDPELKKVALTTFLFALLFSFS